MLTPSIINEFAALLLVEDQAIWDVGDLINQYELGVDDIHALADEVDRAVSTLQGRARLAKMFPADMWDRSAAPIGVWEQLSRLEKPGDRRRLLKSREVWTANEIRKAIDEIVRGAPVPKVAHPRAAVRMTQFEVGDKTVSLKSTLTPEGELSISLPYPLAKGAKIAKHFDDDGKVRLSVRLDMDDDDDDGEQRHLRVIQ